MTGWAVIIFSLVVPLIVRKLWAGAVLGCEVRMRVALVLSGGIDLGWKSSPGGRPSIERLMVSLNPESRMTKIRIRAVPP